MRFFPFQRSLAASRWTEDANSRPIPAGADMPVYLLPVFRFRGRDGSGAARDDREMLLRCGRLCRPALIIGRQASLPHRRVIGPASDSCDASTGQLANHAGPSHQSRPLPALQAHASHAPRSFHLAGVPLPALGPEPGQRGLAGRTPRAGASSGGAHRVRSDLSSCRVAGTPCACRSG